MNKEPVKRINFRAYKVLSRAIVSYSDLNTLFQNLSELICRSFEVKGCSILLFDDREKQLFRVASYGISQEYLSKGPMPIDINDQQLNEGTPIIVKDMQKDPRVLYPDAAKKEGLGTMLCFPIRHRDATLGVVRVYHSEHLELDEYDLESFSLLAMTLGLAIENNGLRNFLEQLKMALGNLPLRMLEGL